MEQAIEYWEELASDGDTPRAAVENSLWGRSDLACESILGAAWGSTTLVHVAENERPGWGAKLGTGRAQAPDGAAWNEALKEAREIFSDVYRAKEGPFEERVLAGRVGHRREFHTAAQEYLRKELRRHVPAILEWHGEGQAKVIQEAQQIAESLRILADSPLYLDKNAVVVNAIVVGAPQPKAKESYG